MQEVVYQMLYRGIVPAGIEIMDKPLIIATENYAKAGYPRDVEALLIVDWTALQAKWKHDTKSFRYS